MTGEDVDDIAKKDEVGQGRMPMTLLNDYTVSSAPLEHNVIQLPPLYSYLSL